VAETPAEGEEGEEGAGGKGAEGDAKPEEGGGDKK
jgi:hypothetical protein